MISVQTEYGLSLCKKWLYPFSLDSYFIFINENDNEKAKLNNTVKQLFMTSLILFGLNIITADFF